MHFCSSLMRRAAATPLLTILPGHRRTCSLRLTTALTGVQPAEGDAESEFSPAWPAHDLESTQIQYLLIKTHINAFLRACAPQTYPCSTHFAEIKEYLAKKRDKADVFLLSYASSLLPLQ